jgi:hypothetical protein
MKLGFDLDGTLDYANIRDEANAAFDAGDEVHIITGHVPGDGYGRPEKLQKVAALGVKFTEMHVCPGYSMQEIGNGKADVINRLGITEMVDDDPTFVSIMRSRTTAKIRRIFMGNWVD